MESGARSRGPRLSLHIEMPKALLSLNKYVVNVAKYIFKLLREPYLFSL